MPMYRPEAVSKTLLARACAAGALGLLSVVGGVGLGLMQRSPPLVLHEAPRLPTSAPASNPVDGATPVVAPPRRGRIVGAEGEEVNLRAEPGTRGARVKGLSDGAELELLGHEVETNGRTWRDVRDPTDGVEGWVAADFLGSAR
jgi:hypothetical protein